MCKVWILEFGDFGFWILVILDFGDFGFWGFWGFWILDFRDFGFWIFGTLCSRSLCAKFGFWNLGILDFGFWWFWILGILDFGDLGFWILDWGFWMGTLWQNFGCYIRKEDCARRTGSADFLNVVRRFNVRVNYIGKTRLLILTWHSKAMQSHTTTQVQTKQYYQLSPKVSQGLNEMVYTQTASGKTSSIL